MILTPEVRMEHVDRRWKAYPAGNKGDSPKFECVAVNMDKSGNCMPRGRKDHEVEPAVMWKRNSMQR